MLIFDVCFIWVWVANGDTTNSGKHQKSGKHSKQGLFVETYRNIEYQRGLGQKTNRLQLFLYQLVSFSSDKFGVQSQPISATSKSALLLIGMCGWWDCATSFCLLGSHLNHFSKHYQINSFFRVVFRIYEEYKVTWAGVQAEKIQRP